MLKINPNISINEPAGVLIKTTCVDFPGFVAGTFFLKGCNLRCPYCYNHKLVKNSNDNADLVTLEDLFSHLEKRKNVLQGLVISGGEPLLNQRTYLIIQKAKELGYKIKIDTNGTLPNQLEELLNDSLLCPDFVAMDFKTSPQKYPLLIGKNSTDSFTANYFSSVLEKSINLISKLPENKREWRTVLVPGLVDLTDIEIMKKMLPENASWQFAQFQNNNCLNPDYNDLEPYSESEINELITKARETIKNSELR